MSESIETRYEFLRESCLRRAHFMAIPVSCQPSGHWLLPPAFASSVFSEEMSMLTGGKLIWKRAIRRARRHMIKEGLLEGGTALRWRITDDGRRELRTKLGQVK